MSLSKRKTMCENCPWNVNRPDGPVPAAVMATVTKRIDDGEEWVCHMTCKGMHVLPGSLLCAGAPATVPG